jgi:hypothetical protein
MANCFSVLLLALALPITSALCPAAESTAKAAAPFAGSIEAERTGNEVLLTWKLPEGGFIPVEIYRNTNSSTAGRGRVNTARTDVTQLLDQVPDLTVKYWYWIKLIRPDNTHLNIGPVATPEATVWTP